MYLRFSSPRFVVSVGPAVGVALAAVEGGGAAAVVVDDL